MTRGCSNSVSASSTSGWLLLVCAALATGCGGKAPKPAATPAAAAYADAKVCATCHAEIAQSYAQTGMGRSIGPALAANVPSQVVHRASGLTYAIAARDGSLYQRRTQPGFEGREAFVAEKRAELAIGSGNHARSFLSRNAEGKWVQLPVTWYAARGGFWEMSPGYERADQEDFRRVVPDDCLFCHSSYQQPLQAIDCQRCHGPGQTHAASAGRQPILNPKKLSRERQLEVCMQCHLETTSSPLPHAIRRFDREVYSYRPGEPLADYSLYFDHPPGKGYDAKFEIAHAAYRLRKSACFQKSQMTCSTCHDPHAVRRDAAAARCQQCHPAAHHARTSCIGCHMPKRSTADAVHVSMTDHFIERRPATGAAPQLPTYQGEVQLYYPPQLPPTAESEAYLAVAQVHHGANLAAGIPRLQAAVAKLAPAAPDFYFELAKAASKNGDEAGAARWYQHALERNAGFLPAVKGLAASLLALRRFDQAAALLGRQQNPDARMLTNLGQALLESGRVDEAADKLTAAIRANPDLAEPHDLLGLVALRRADAPRAEAEFREALRVHPHLATAHANLASVLAGRKDLAEAQHHYRRALAIDSNAGETHRNYGFLLILMRDYPQAHREFQAAVRLDPANTQARLDLAEFEVAGGRPREALTQYQEALRRAPDSAEAHLGMGVLLLQLGQSRDEAQSHLRQAATSPDPATRDAALKALSAGADRPPR